MHCCNCASNRRLRFPDINASEDEDDRYKLPELVYQNSYAGPCFQFDDTTTLSNCETTRDVIDGNRSTEEEQCVHRDLIVTKQQ